MNIIHLCASTVPAANQATRTTGKCPLPGKARPTCRHRRPRLCRRRQAFGHQLERDTSVVTANGGQVLSTIRHPLNTSDFSSYLLRAQFSDAKVIALANAGADMANATGARKKRNTAKP